MTIAKSPSFQAPMNRFANSRGSVSSDLGISLTRMALVKLIILMSPSIHAKYSSIYCYYGMTTSNFRKGYRKPNKINDDHNGNHNQPFYYTTERFVWKTNVLVLTGSGTACRRKYMRRSLVQPQIYVPFLCRVSGTGGRMFKA